jgi:hypothetical protein
MSGMGRPKLHNTTVIQLYLSLDHIARIDALMGRHRRGIFLRSAVERELARVESAVKKAEKAQLKVAAEVGG